MLILSSEVRVRFFIDLPAMPAAPSAFVSVANMVNKPREAGLKILMVAPQPFFRPRGTPFSVLHRIRGLTTMGHKVDLITIPLAKMWSCRV